MKELGRHKGWILAVVTVFLLALAGMTMDEEGRTGTFGDVLSVPLRPLRQAGLGISRFFEERIAYFRDLKALSEENELLREAYRLAASDRAELEALRRENADLRAALVFAERHTAYSLLPSRIISRETDNWNDLLILDVGRRDGLDLGLKAEYPGYGAVVSGEGLVGRILRTAYNTAKVLTITDHGSAVSGVLTRNRQQVEVKGLFELRAQGLCYVGNIDYDTDVAVGDSVETSGIGNLYPGSVLIGIIESIHRDESAKTVYALLRPAVDFKRLETMYILIPEEPE